jgi:DNA-binding NarL/FixJ family response regulator
MTDDRRSSRSGTKRKDSAPPSTESSENQVTSGVFRATNEAQPAGQRYWREGWTVAEQFIREGFYYRLLRRPLNTKQSPPRLTPREDDVLRLACEGHSNKSIAQALDVSASTVGVLIFRAASKLNVATRAELLAAYRERAAGSAPVESDVPPSPNKSKPDR